MAVPTIKFSYRNPDTGSTKNKPINVVIPWKESDGFTTETGIVTDDASVLPNGQVTLGVQVGQTGRLAHIRGFDIPANTTFNGTIKAGASSPPAFASSSDSLNLFDTSLGLKMVFPNVSNGGSTSTTLDLGTTINPEWTLVHSSAAYHEWEARHVAPDNSNIVVEWHVQAWPSLKMIEWQLVITFSNDQVTTRTELFDSLADTEAGYCKLVMSVPNTWLSFVDMNLARGGLDDYGINGSFYEVTLQDYTRNPFGFTGGKLYLGDGQGLAFKGACLTASPSSADTDIYNHRKNISYGILPVGIADPAAFDTNYFLWGRSQKDTLHSSLQGAASITAAKARFDAWVSDVQSRESSARSIWTKFWGFIGNPADTGEKDDHGVSYDFLTNGVQGGNSLGVYELWPVALMERSRPIFFYKRTGSVANYLEWSDYSDVGSNRLVFWVGRPHFSTGSSPERLGKTDTSKPLYYNGLNGGELYGSSGFFGYDMQHYSMNQIIELYRRTGNTFVERILKHHGTTYRWTRTLEPGPTPSGPDAARSLRTEHTIAHIWASLVSGESTLRNNIKQRMIDRLNNPQSSNKYWSFDYWRKYFNNSGKEYCPVTWDLVGNNIGHNRNGPNLAYNPIWEGTLQIGALAQYLVTKDTRVLEFAYYIQAYWLKYGFYPINGITKPRELVQFVSNPDGKVPSGRIPPSSWFTNIYDKNSNKGGTVIYSHVFNHWVDGAAECGLILAELAESVGGIATAAHIKETKRNANEILDWQTNNFKSRSPERGLLDKYPKWRHPGNGSVYLGGGGVGGGGGSSGKTATLSYVELGIESQLPSVSVGAIPPVVPGIVVNLPTLELAVSSEIPIGSLTSVPSVFSSTLSGDLKSPIVDEVVTIPTADDLLFKIVVIDSNGTELDATKVSDVKLRVQVTTGLLDIVWGTHISLVSSSVESLVYSAKIPGSMTAGLPTQLAPYEIDVVYDNSRRTVARGIVSVIAGIIES